MPRPSIGIQIRLGGEPHDGAQSLARRAAGTEAVAQALLEIGHAGALIERQDFELGEPVRIVRAGIAQQNLAAGRMLQQIGAGFGDDDRNPFGLSLVQADLFGHAAGDPAHFGRLASFFDGDPDGLGHAYLHLRIETLVPSPIFDRISNSWERRLAPPSPSPMPCPDGVAVRQRQFDIGDARSLIFKDEPQAGPPVILDYLKLHGAAAAVIQQYCGPIRWKR